NPRRLRLLGRETRSPFVLHESLVDLNHSDPGGGNGVDPPPETKAELSAGVSLAQGLFKKEVAEISRIETGQCLLTIKSIVLSNRTWISAPISAPITTPINISNSTSVRQSRYEVGPLGEVLRIEVIHRMGISRKNKPN